MKDLLAEKIKNLPLSPGVYIFRDDAGEILYIGKARQLRKRVASYFQNKDHSPKVEILIQKIRNLDTIDTSTEVDALLLEASLIQKYQPRYNTLAKDDRSFPYIKITGEKFPMIHLTRKKDDRKATYYGPFTDAGLLRDAVAIIHRIFPIRKCITLPKTACLYYHIGQCVAPCIKPEIKGEYDNLIQEVREFIGGGKKTLIEYLTQKMHAASDRLAFEEAQFYKQQIAALGKLTRKRFYRSRDISGVSLSATSELKKALGLSRAPERIVCFDVSNIQGAEAVASRVCFYYEMPDKNEYRRYKIKTVEGIDDFKMIQEAVRRMCRGIKDGREAFYPDLIMIDGGKGQLSSAFQVLQEEGFQSTALCSLAKRFEHLYLPGNSDPIILPQDSKALHLVQRIRDEAHRFAITYHRRLHGKLVDASVLDKIEGLGPKRKRLLLTHFESIEQIRDQSKEVLAALPGMNRPLAAKILAYLQNDP